MNYPLLKSLYQPLYAPLLAAAGQFFYLKQHSHELVSREAKFLSFEFYFHPLFCTEWYPSTVWKGRHKIGKLNKQTFVKFGHFSHYIFVIFLQIMSKVVIFIILVIFQILFSRVDGFSLTGPTQKLKIKNKKKNLYGDNVFIQSSFK